MLSAGPGQATCGGQSSRPYEGYFPVGEADHDSVMKMPDNCRGREVLRKRRKQGKAVERGSAGIAVLEAFSEVKDLC